MATKKTKATTKTKAKGTSNGPTWRLGLFRNDHGRLVTVYVNSDGEVMPYQRRQVADRPVLFTGAYSDMKYSEARQQLLKDAKAQKGLVDEVVEKAPKVAKAAKATKKGSKKAKASSTKTGRRQKAAASAPTS